MTCVSTNTTTQLIDCHPQQMYNTCLYDALQQIDTLTQPHKPWSADTFHSLLANKHHYLLYVTPIKHTQKSAIPQAKVSSVILGFCLYQQLFETAEILRIAAHPLYQRQGIGKQMLRGLFDKLTQQQAQHILLEVRADNAAAIGLYQQHGFVQIDTRKGYYSPTRQPATQQNQHQFEVQPRVDALIMQKMLSTQTPK